LLAVGCAAPGMAAQPMETPRRGNSQEAPMSSEGPVQEAQPPVLFLRNKDGGLLQAVLGFTLEDFERFMNQRAQLGLGQQPPRFQLERLVANGHAGERQAELSVELSVAVNQPGWVRVPLRLSQAVMRSKPRYQGPGDYRLEFDSAAKEYVLWLRGDGDKPHQLTLDLAAPLEKLADQTELRLGLPRAAVSEFVFTVPDPSAVATVREGGLLDSTSHGKNSTDFKVLGMERDFALVWHKQNAGDNEIVAPLEGAGILDVRVDATGIHTDVQLTVRTFGSKLDSFRLKVPANATVTSTEQPGYTIESAPSERGKGEVGQTQLCEVRLRDKVATPLTVRFALDQPLDEEAGQRDFDLTGVELVGAARQSGYVAVRVTDGWHIDWGELRQARQVEEIPKELERDGVLASFEYFGKPYSIAGRLAPLKTHLSVEPFYSVDVDGQQIRLQSRLTYQARGAKVFALEIAMPGWELDDVAPRGTFDVDRVAVEADKPIRVPLLQPTTGGIELLLRAHRKIAPAATQIEFDLPRPVTDATAPAQLSVMPAENVSLTVRETELVGLMQIRGDSLDATFDEAGRQPLKFRGQSGKLHFAADLQIETRTVVADIRTQFTLDAEAAHVDETIDYSVMNEPLGALSLDVPTWLSSADRIEWQLDDQPVTPTSDTSESSVERTVRYRLVLPEKRQGKFRLSIKYPLRIGTLTADRDLPIDVPLVMPTVTELASNVLTVKASPGIKVEQRDSGWNAEVVGADRSHPAGMRLTNPLASGEVALAARREETRNASPAVVERAWIQSRLAGGERWDRAVFKIQGAENSLTLHLPPGAIAAEAQVILDGTSVAASSAARDTLSVAIPAGVQTHVLDVSYRFATRSAEQGHLQLVPPSIEDAPWMRQTYWQLVLPRDEHLLGWPADLTGMFQWRLENGIWVRQPLVEQPHLEAWTQTTAGPDIPRQTNRYVLTAMGPIEELNIYVVSRVTLVAAAAGTVLTAGLLLLNFKSLRHPAALFIVGILLLAAAAMFPEVAMLIAQVAALGAVLAGLSALLARYLNSRHRSPLVIRTGPSSVHEPGSTKTHLRVQASSSSGQSVPRIPQASASPGDS
jgi:hypothetical protein